MREAKKQQAAVLSAVGFDASSRSGERHSLMREDEETREAKGKRVHFQSVGFCAVATTWTRISSSPTCGTATSSTATVGP